MDTEKVFQQFKADYQFRLNIRTVEDYLRTMKQLLNFIKKPFDAVSKNDIRAWLNELSEREYKPGSIHSKVAGLKTFYKYCWEEGLIEENPVKSIPFPKIGDSIPRYLTHEQFTRLRELVSGNVLERTLIEVLYSTGIRISELVAMKKEDINWSERSILIQEGKGEVGRIVLFNTACEGYLKAYLNNRTDDVPSVFVNPKTDRPIYKQYVNTKFQSYSEQLNFHVTPHMLRHTFSAHLAQKGMPLVAIQTLLGHVTPYTTQLYARLYDHARKKKYDELM